MESTSARASFSKPEEESDWIPLTPPRDEGSESSTSSQESFSASQNYIETFLNPLRRCIQVDNNQKDISINDKLTMKDSVFPSNSKTWYNRLALFGDSALALACSALLLVVAVIVSLSLEDKLISIKSRSAEDIAYAELGPAPKITPPKIFHASYDKTSNLISPEMRLSFERDGVIAVRGLIQQSLLDDLDKATMKLVQLQKEKNDAKAKQKPKILTGQKLPAKQFFTVNQGTIFLPPDNLNTRTNPFVTVAMKSDVPKFAANLLQGEVETCTNETVRILRDIFLAKDEEEYICGWHVDDIGFWPALSDSSGINAWIALDDMPLKHGGGFALAVGSHTAPWKEEAYNLTGSTHTFPKDGFKSSRDILHNRPGNGTCNIKDTAPRLHKRMEETKRIYEVERGDVIFHHRWLFHRTVPFERSTVAERISNSEEPLMYRRYSIRYGPGSSIIPPGYGTEPSVISDGRNGGRTADEVCQYDAAWYPKVWPTISENELEQMDTLAKQRLPSALEKSEQRKRVIRPRKTRQH